MNSTPTPANRRTRTGKALPWMLLGLSAAWLLLIVVTDQLAWPLAVSIAALAQLAARNARVEPRKP